MVQPPVSLHPGPIPGGELYTWAPPPQNLPESIVLMFVLEAGPVGGVDLAGRLRDEGVTVSCRAVYRPGPAS